MDLFSRGSRPAADQEAFRSRLDRTLALIRHAGLERAACLSLARRDLLTAFEKRGCCDSPGNDPLELQTGHRSRSLNRRPANRATTPRPDRDGSPRR
jgi:hypothetical protein